MAVPYLLTITLLLLTRSALGQQPSPHSTTCYAPDGSNATQTTITNGGVTNITSQLYTCPAGTDGYATCCLESDYCHPDNLCYNPNGGTPTVYRQYCTDKNWRSSSCSPLCHGGEYGDGPAMLTACGDGKFCCGFSNTTCCTDHEGDYAIQGTQVGPGLSASASASTSVSASPAGATTAPGSATTTTIATSCNKNSGISGGGIAAVVVDVIAALALLGASALLVMRRRDRKRFTVSSQPKYADAGHAPKESAHAGDYNEIAGEQRHEMPNGIAKPSGRSFFELDSTSRQ